MTAFWKDMRAFMQRAAAATPVVLQVEPDMWGYARAVDRHEGRRDAVPAQVSTTGLTELAGLPNDRRLRPGLRAAARQIRARTCCSATSCRCGARTTTRSRRTSGWRQIDALADRSTAFEQSLGATFDLVVHRPVGSRRRLRPDQSTASGSEPGGIPPTSPASTVRGRLRARRRPADGALADTHGQPEDAGHEQHLGPLPGQPRRLVARRLHRDPPGQHRQLGRDRDALRRRARAARPAPATPTRTASPTRRRSTATRWRRTAPTMTAATSATRPRPTTPAGRWPSPAVSHACTTTRLFGADRYATAAAVSAATFAPGVPVVYIASGLGLPRRAVRSAAAATRVGPVLLVTTTAIPPPPATELDATPASAHRRPRRPRERSRRAFATSSGPTPRGPSPRWPAPTATPRPPP